MTTHTQNEEQFLSGGFLKGELHPPGDKSISHRSVIFGSLASGTSHFKNFLQSEDCLRTLEAFKQMGVTAKLEGDELTLEGVGLEGLKAPQSDLEMGNSGTSTRLLLGVLAAQKFTTHLKGDPSLSQRPMLRVVEPLRQMGAQIDGEDKGNLLPLTVSEASLQGIQYRLPVASAQVKSALLLAGLFAGGVTEIEEPTPSRDHTERAFQAFGAPYEKNGSLHRIQSGSLQAVSYEIPADVSSAAFFIVGALISTDSEVCLRRVGLNPTRSGLLSVLERMGADIKIENRVDAIEPYGDLIIRSSQLKGTVIEGEEIPLLIDELPILALAAALAEGETVIQGAEELRFKESDRIAVMAECLNAVGAQVQELKDGFKIKGVDQLKGGSIEAAGDHRVAMTFAIASLRSEESIQVKGWESVATSYPDFKADLSKLRQWGNGAF